MHENEEIAKYLMLWVSTVYHLTATQRWMPLLLSLDRHLQRSTFDCYNGSSFFDVIRDDAGSSLKHVCAEHNYAFVITRPSIGKWHGRAIGDVFCSREPTVIPADPTTRRASRLLEPSSPLSDRGCVRRRRKRKSVCRILCSCTQFFTGQ